MSTKKLIKKAKKNPGLYSPAEVCYFKLIRKLEKLEKQKKKQTAD